MYRFEAPPRICFGENALDSLLELPHQGRALLVTDPFMVSSGTVTTVTGRLDRMELPYTVFSEIEPDPSIATITTGLQVLLREKPSTLIALGGGSAIDAAKAMLYFSQRFKEGLMEAGHVPKPLFVAIPTTSGTGSEVTSYAVVTDRERGVKIPLSSPAMIPDLAVLDPAYTKTLPAAMVAFTGMDVLTHALEAYVSKGHNDFTDLMAREAATAVLRHLPAIHADISDAHGRERMHNASTMAGLAFTNAGLGICHGIAHTVGAEFHLPHGKANALILPYVVAFNGGLGKYGGHSPAQREAAGRYAALARDIGLGGDSDTDGCRRLACAVLVLCERFGIATALGENGVERGLFHERRLVCAEKILQDITTRANPVPVTATDIAALLDDIYEGVLQL